MLQSALEALRAKTKNALTRFEDAYPQWLEKYVAQSSNPSNPNASSEPVQVEGEIASDPVIRASIKKAKRSNNGKKNSPADSDNELIDEKQNSLINVEIWFKNSKQTENSSESPKAVLPDILASLKDVNNKTIHAALNEAGFIRSGNEFISGGM